MSRIVGFGLLFTVLYLGTASGLSVDSVEVGLGYEFKWSPSGRQISAWRGDSLLLIDAATGIRRAVKSAGQPDLCFWRNEEQFLVAYSSHTEASRPCDQMRISRRGVMDLTGEYTELFCDTLWDAHNYVSPWQEFPDGRIGCLRVAEGRPSEYLVLAGSELVRVIPDWPAAAECSQAISDSNATCQPSPDSTHFVVYRGERMISIQDSSGQTVFELGPRVREKSQGRYEYTDKIAWSPDGMFLSITKETEDGHYSYGSELQIFDLKSRTLKSLQVTTNELTITCAWSPARNDLLVGCGGKMSIMRFRVE